MKAIVKVVGIHALIVGGAAAAATIAWDLHKLATYDALKDVTR